MGTLWPDIRYGLRMLVKAPGFTVVAVVTLALGIGANTAIFSVVNRLLLNPLPFKDGHRIVYLWRGSPQVSRIVMLPSAETISLWREEAKSFEGMEAFSYREFVLTGEGEPESIVGKLVSPSLFTFLGVEPQLGRTFLPQEAQPGADRVAVISHGFWKRRFGSDPGILGRQVTLNHESYAVVGVMPPRFRLFRDNEQLWAPRSLNPTSPGAPSPRFYVIARLKPGVTVRQAQSELDVLSTRIVDQGAHTKGWTGIIKTPQDHLGPNTPRAILVLFVAVGFVLLIACANIANLMLARNAGREKEIAIRLALGAGRARLIRQLLVESLLLALAGGAAGILLAYWGLDLIIALRPDEIPQLEDVNLSRGVIGFSLGLSALTGVLCGLLPAVQASRPNLQQALKQGAPSGSTAIGKRFFQKAMVVAEVALSLMLLVGAGLMVRSFARLQSDDPGFKPEKIVSMRLTLPKNRYPEKSQQSIFFRQLLERIRQLPGVNAADLASSIPPFINIFHGRLEIEGRAVEEADQPPLFSGGHVGPDYFQTIGIPVLRGRAFTEQDDQRAAKAVVINEEMTRRYWPGEDPIGQHIRFDAKDDWSTIVGVVGSVKAMGLDLIVSSMQTYFPYDQDPEPAMVVIVRAAANPARLIPALKGQVWGLDRDLPITELMTLEQALSDALARPRFNLVLLSTFALLAVILSAVGIYGLLSYSVSQRTREIGIRLALGAEPRDILRLAVGQGMVLTLIGAAIGLVSAVALTRFIASLLFGVSPTDPLTFALITLLLAGVALAACYLPARRAMRVDPMVALRYE